MDKLKVRFYNVLFGDAILIEIPDKDNKTGKTSYRHILIDVGNVLSTKGKKGELVGDNTVFKPVIEDVQKVLKKRKKKSLDLFVMTHEHLDHVQGLFYCSHEHKLDLKVDYVWLTASADPNYYDTHPEAEKEKKLYLSLFQNVERYFQFAAAELNEQMFSLLNNNNPSKTKDCIDYLRGLAKPQNITYIHRECDLKHPFKEATFKILAPEEDTSVYYGRFQPMQLGLSELAEGDAKTFSLTEFTPPSGVDAGAFFNLVDFRRNSISDNLLAIDKAANNTSIVFCLEWRGYRLLFCGDAEQRSWKTILKEAEDKLEPIHLLKVSHHGSSNGLPVQGVLDKILPLPAPDGKNRYAAVSTCLGAYNGVPHDDTLNILRERCEIKSTKDDIPAGKNYFDIEFPA